MKTTSPNWKTSSTNFQTTASLSCWVTLTFNIDLSKNNRSHFKRLLNNLSWTNLDQLITEPTRITETSHTTIDLIFVNNTQRIVRSGVIPCALSDHSLMFCVFKAGVTKAPPRIIEYRSYKHYNKESFLQDLRNNNWSATVDDNDINATIDNWCKCFTDIADLHVSIKKMKVKGVNIPWMTAELSQAMQPRDHHLKKAQTPVKNTLVCIPKIPLLRKQKSV